MDTIFALASGPPPAAVSVIRISGPQAGTIVNVMTGATLNARIAKMVDIRDPLSRELLDRGLALWFPGPTSFTGEDCAEFQVHGSRAVIISLLEALGKFANSRPAKAGEFTRRAFINGKIDLTAAEGLGDLIDSETELQRKQALSALTGSLARRASGWREELLSLLALIEAFIDFADEGDAPTSIQSEISVGVNRLADEIRSFLGDNRRGECIRDGYSVVILGPPNAGKSALMNALAQRDVAIVSSRAGTTRDLIEVRIDLGGAPVTFVDTAGIRETNDEIELEGIQRARARAETADLVLWLNEIGGPDPPPPSLDRDRICRVETKADLAPDLESRVFSDDRCRISVLEKSGVDDLLSIIQSRLGFDRGGVEFGGITRARQRKEIEGSLTAICNAGRDALAFELVVEELRLAARYLENLIGVIENEDVLDEIFRRFCMGK